MKLRKTTMAAAAFGLVLGMMAVGTSQAEITIETVTVGNAGNANDTTGYGGVAYTYNIGKYEVSLTQYTAFLNAVAATDPYSLYNTSMGTDLNIAGISRSGISGSYSYSVIGSGNRPVTYVSWFDAARFANWMANGQATGAQDATTTENGAYTLDGATSGVGFTKNETNPNNGQAVNWWIPSENEWYKAAYYQPAAQGGDTDSYWMYPTASNTAPGNAVGAGANQANYNNGVFSVTQSATYDPLQNYLTDGGAFSNSASFYGTYDQGGNVYEWDDAVIGSSRGIRQACWNSNALLLLPSMRVDYDPTTENNWLGFRVASVPEPSSGLLLLMAGGALWVRRRKMGGRRQA